jgi:chromosome partitioning protein
MATTRGERTRVAESGDAMGEEGLVKGLGWPYQLSPGGAGGLGWPVPARAGRDVAPAENDQGQEQVASLATTAPAQDALTRDTRHVVSVVPGSAPGCHVPPSQSPPDHEAATPSAHRVAPSILADWGGAAPVVVQGGVFWPPGGDGIQVVVEEPLQTGVSRETPAILSPLPASLPGRPAGPESGVEATTEPVSRETNGTQGPSADRNDDESGVPIDVAEFECDIDTRESVTVCPSVQTAPVHAEWQDQDGSVRMRQSSTAPGGTQEGQTWTARPSSGFGYDDDQRLDLANSLPQVDDSTPLAFEIAEDARRRISLVGRSFPHPPHTRVLTVANQKGGVGKTTTTVNVAAAMAQSGLNIMVLDIDPQGNASTALGIDHHSEIPSLYDVVVEQRPLGEVLQSCPDIPNLLCAPATIDMAGAEIELVSLVAREVRLQRALREYLDDREAHGLPRIDYVFIDCPPSLSLLTVNAFVAADEVFIPIQCEYYALEGLSQLLKHIELIRGHLNPTLHVSTILLTMYDGRTRLSSQVADEVREHFPDTVLKTSVPRSVRISEAPSHGQTVMTYDPASSGALSYLEAARELAEQVLTWTDRSKQEERS